MLLTKSRIDDARPGLRRVARGSVCGAVFSGDVLNDLRNVVAERNGWAVHITSAEFAAVGGGACPAASRAFSNARWYAQGGLRQTHTPVPLSSISSERRQIEHKPLVITAYPYTCTG